jgi:ABC-type dipeptide/oligopeptide/nickel transport system permease component
VALFLARRLGFNLVVLGVVVVVVSALLRIAPVDPVDVALGSTLTPVSEETEQQMRVELGLNGSALEQMGRYMGDLAQGDMGESLVTRVPVSQIIDERLPATIELALAALVVALLIALPVGVLSALGRDRFADTAGSVFVLVGFAIPSFLLGIVLIYVFSVRLGWLPTSGRPVSVWQAIGDGSPSELATALRYLALPALALGITLAAISARMIRSSMLEALRQDYVRFARAKGLPRRAVTFHAFRNALIPVVTVLGLQLGYLLSGAYIIENVFAWPGLGQQAVQAINTLDYTVVQGVVLVSAALFLTVNLIVDLLYMAIDPRVRLQNRR